MSTLGRFSAEPPQSSRTLDFINQTFRIKNHNLIIRFSKFQFFRDKKKLKNGLENTNFRMHGKNGHLLLFLLCWTPFCWQVFSSNRQLYRLKVENRPENDQKIDPKSIFTKCLFLFLAKNAESIGENPVLWFMASFTPCGAGILRSMIRKKHGIEGSLAMDIACYM